MGKSDSEYKSLLEKIGQKLKAARLHRSLTQANAAELLGFDFRHYQNIESGRVNVKFSSLVTIIRFIDEPVDSIISFQEDTNSPFCLLNLGRDEKIIYMNAYLAKLLGSKKNGLDFIGMNWFDHFIPQETREPLRKHFHNGFRCEIFRKGFQEYENEVVTSNGKILIIKWLNSYLQSPNSRELTKTSSIGAISL